MPHMFFKAKGKSSQTDHMKMLISQLERDNNRMISNNWLENAYYIAFIVFTLILVIFTIKTYVFQTKADSSLFCKLFIMREELGKVEQSLCLEIYNHGNTPAKRVSASINGDILGTIDYIKPEDSSFLIVGQVFRMMGCNRVYILDKEISEETEVTLEISVNGEKADSKLLQTSTVFLHNSIVHNEDERIAQATEDINRTLEKAFDCQHIGAGHNSFRDELCDIAKSIKTKQ